jgi:hypothetical protein
MADASLTKRLRQHSQRAGVMVGLSMALTISLLIGGFVVIYGWSGQYFSDFIPADSTATPTVAPGATLAAAPTAAAVGTGAADLHPTAAPTTPPTPAATQPPAFQPTHQIAGTNRINFRAGPGGPGSGFDIITTLDPGTPLQYLDERDDSSGQPWMKFKIEQGNEGWVREWDVEPYQPTT